MAHLWIHSEADDEGMGWSRRALGTGGSFDALIPGVRVPRGQFCQNRDGTWIVLSGPESSLQVNGMPVPGMAVLRDRDEMSLNGHTIFFSTEQLAEIKPFPTQDSEARCPRCKTELNLGQPAVCCPSCGVWYHESPDDDLPCWTHSSECRICKHTTSLGGAWQWVPEGV